MMSRSTHVSGHGTFAERTSSAPSHDKAPGGVLQEPDILLTPSMLPREVPMYFRESSFFCRNTRDLPSPSEVRAAAGPNRIVTRPPPVIFADLGLIVKFGEAITIAEGQCLWAIRRFLNNIPVPEIYGWCRDGNDFFLFMELVQGETLEKKWDNMTTEEKYDICNELKGVTQSLRRLKQDPLDVFIGHIGKQPLQDTIFEQIQCSPPVCFLSVREFHDWFTEIRSPQDAPKPHLYRHMLPDNLEIVFSHADLHPSNIIISIAESGHPRLVSIIDWHQSGWLPEYWEFCKTNFTMPSESEWRKDYIPRFLAIRDEYYMWDYFVLRLGC